MAVGGKMYKIVSIENVVDLVDYVTCLIVASSFIFKG